MTLSYNLIDQPWIPCMDGNGDMRDLSLREMLARAPDLREVVDPSPLVTVALHRFLLAVLHRCFGPEDDAVWAALRERGAFDMKVFDAYFEEWCGRFDLFDADRPFYQTPGLSLDSAASIARLTHELNSGNNPALFDHSLDEAPVAISPASAARYIVALQAFAVGGLLSFGPGEQAHRSGDAAHLLKGAVVLVRGRSLFETLVLNMVVVNHEDERPFRSNAERDAPAWERSEPTRPLDREPDGYLDLLTWQSRRALLLPEETAEGVVVPRAIVMKGYQFPGSSLHDRETMVAYRKREKAAPGQDPFPPVGFRPERALWRDSVALITRTDPGMQERVRTVNELAARCWEGYLPADVPTEISALGLSSDRAKLFLWRHERLPLPLAYLRDDALVVRLGEATKTAENVAGVVRTATARLAAQVLSPEGTPDRDRLRALIESLAPERAYWPKLDAPFRELVVALAASWGADRGEGALNAWNAEVRLAANTAFDAAARAVETNGRGFRAAAEARGLFRALLFKELSQGVHA